MSAQWKKPTTLGLTEKLREVSQRLHEALPLVVEAHVKAVEGMAKTAVVAQKKPVEGDHV